MILDPGRRCPYCCVRGCRDRSDAGWRTCAGGCRAAGAEDLRYLSGTRPLGYASGVGGVGASQLCACPFLPGALRSVDSSMAGSRYLRRPRLVPKSAEGADANPSDGDRRVACLPAVLAGARTCVTGVRPGRIPDGRRDRRIADSPQGRELVTLEIGGDHARGGG